MTQDKAQDKPQDKAQNRQGGPGSLSVSDAPRPAWADAPDASPAGTPTDSAPSEAASPEPVTVISAVPEVSTEQTPLNIPLGRPPRADLAVTPAETVRTAPQASPQERLRRQAWLGMGSRVVGGLLTLAVLIAALTSGWSWSSVLFLWVLLTILADEFGGWFGYAGAFLGLLTVLGGGQDPAVWKVVLPLVGGALLGLLVVKHSGGWGVLPFAGAAFALPIVAAAQFGHILDPNLLLVADPDLQRSALLAMIVGLGVSFVRQLIMWVVDLTGRRAERRLLQADQLPLR